MMKMLKDPLFELLTTTLVLLLQTIQKVEEKSATTN